MLADALMQIDSVEVRDQRAHTNMVFISLSEDNSAGDRGAFQEYAKDQGLLLGGRDVTSTIRLVTHKQVSEQHILDAVQIIA